MTGLTTHQTNHINKPRLVFDAIIIEILESVNMKNKAVKLMIIIMGFVLLAALILNLWPGLEEALHKITGWN